MGKYNFDEIIERHDTYSYKWDLMPSYDVLPLWVADMDFKAAPAIFKEVNRLAQNGVYGYGCIPENFYKAIVDFHKRHYGQEVHKDWIIPTPAVVPALTAVLQALTQPGDEVIVQTPAYNCFFSCLSNSGVVTVENPICYQDGEFKLDFEDLEAKAKSPKAKVLLFCNPQNPTGRLWTKKELLKVLEICKKHNLIVISDEVHCDIKPNTSVFTAFSTLDKSFNDKVITLR
ncbi:MAG: aminotransferase class I/II-fold pyridoxal phosphate-dependent enzyme, partial [Succinivibrio sp.]|nr:aminotransferase class I/II-fold pyridoxal phosphate-dependent enzyme [Succinivibrio sp.]